MPNNTSIAPAASARRWFILTTVLIGAFMAILDVTIVNVAIPSIREKLHSGYGSVELVVTGYTIAYASLLMIGGRLGDIFGRRRLFIVGLVLFGGASALCGLAPNIGVLIAARALQGVGGACFYPQILAIIQRTFEGEERGKALGIFGAALGMSAIAGQVIGGLMIHANLLNLAWRPIFLVNVPLAIIAIGSAFVVLPHDDDRERTRIDFGGVVLITTMLVCLCVPLLEGRDLHWPLWLIAMLVASPVVAAGFARYEQRVMRHDRTPLMRLSLLSNPHLRSGMPIALLFMVAYASFLFLFSVYVQTVLGFSALHSGLTYLPAAVSFLLGSLWAPKLTRYLGRYVLSGGYILASIGLLVTAVTAEAAGLHLVSWELIPGLFVTGLGLGLGFSPLVGAIVAGLQPSEAGSGAGIVTTTLQAGNVLGVAIISLIFFSLAQHFTGSLAGTYAFALSFAVSAAALLGAAFFVQRLPRSPSEAGNAFLERLPSWASSIAYSMFLMTGGRMSDGALHNLFQTVGGRRIARARTAPDKPGDFMIYHFEQAAADSAFLHYLMREALVNGSKTVPHEAERKHIIRAQVEEIQRRQAAGLLPSDISPEALRLAVFALVRYPYILPQITRMVTGAPPEDPAFQKSWEALLRRLGDLLEQDAAKSHKK